MDKEDKNSVEDAEIEDIQEKEKFVSTWFRASLTVENIKSGFLLKKKTTNYDNSQVDFDDYADQLVRVYEELDSSGYDVINVVPMITGQTEVLDSKSPDYLNYSITRGAVVIGKLKE